MLVTDRPSAMAAWLLSAWVLLYWGWRLAGPPPGVAHVLAYVSDALFAAALVAGVFILRPSSRDLRRGSRLVKAGDLDGAAVAYRRVIGSGRRDEVALAAFKLGGVLIRQGDLDGAGAAFRRAIDAGEPRIVPAAAFNLGWVLESQGDDEGARAAYEHAAGVRGAAQAAKAALALGRLLERQGDAEGARTAYQQAIHHGPPDVREPAARALHELDGTQADS
jgi:TolA-binding protein